MEKLIFIAVVVVATILHAWWTRNQVQAEQRERERERGTAQPPGRDETSSGGSPRPPSAPPPRPSPLDWEEQMRRLLEGVLPTPPQPPPPRPRPSASVPPTVPPLLPPPPAHKPKAVPAAPLPFLAKSNIPVPDEGMEMEVGLPVRPVSLHRAATAHDRAQIQTNVADRLHATSARVTSHGRPEVARPRSSVGAEVRALVGTRRSAQVMMVAATILGPPRAMDPIE